MKNFSRWGPAFELSRTLMKTMLARFLITRFLRLVNPQFSIQLDGTRPSQVPQPTWEVMSVGKPDWTWPDNDGGKTCVSLDQELSVQRLWEGRHSNNRGELKILQRPKTHYVISAGTPHISWYISASTYQLVHISWYISAGTPHILPPPTSQPPTPQPSLPFVVDSQQTALHLCISAR